MATLGNGDDNSITGGSGSDTVFAQGGNDTVSGLAGQDRLLGGSGDDNILGGNGDDAIGGGEGNDKLLGGAGNDVISGGTGSDVLGGGTGDDLLIGGADRDTLSGGSGADTFVFLARTDSLAGTGVRDIVLDFQHGVDKIGLAALGLSSADIDLSAWFGGTSMAGSYAQLLRISTNHDGVFDMEIQLNGTHGEVTFADIIL